MLINSQLFLKIAGIINFLAGDLAVSFRYTCSAFWFLILTFLFLYLWLCFFLLLFSWFLQMGFDESGTGFINIWPSLNCSVTEFGNYIYLCFFYCFFFWTCPFSGLILGSFLVIEFMHGFCQLWSLFLFTKSEPIRKNIHEAKFCSELSLCFLQNI